jgi:nucleotide-binding universal stress UspA family protein
MFLWMSVKTIVVPTDFSSNAEAAFELAGEFAEKFDAKIVLVHVRQEPLIPAATMHPDLQLPASLHADIKAAADKALESTKNKFDTERVAEIRAVDGRAHHGICDAARELNADLIVMATHGHSGIAHLLLGSTAERVLRGAPCPVVTVRPTKED